jgi:lysophospholipase L1-like esterase
MANVTLSSDMDAFLTTANDAAARAELGVTSAINYQSEIPNNADFIFEGDSITAGHGGATPWSTFLATMSNFANRGTITNVAVSSSTLNSGATQIVGRYTSTVKPLIDASVAAGKIPYLIVMIGINDISLGNVTSGTVDTWFAAYEAYAAQAQTDGAKVVICTVLTRSNNTNLMINAVNGRIRQSTVFDACIDTTMVHIDPASTRFTAVDGLHPNTAGNMRLAKYINDEMGHLGRGVFQSTITQDTITWQYSGSNTASPEGTCNHFHRNLGIVIGTTQPVAYSGLNFVGTASVPGIRFSDQTGDQQDSAFCSLVIGAGNVHTGSFSGDLALVGKSGRGISLATNTSGNTQTLRVRLTDAGVFTMSGITDFAIPKTITAAGTTGARTINQNSGSVNFAAAASSLVVTNSLVTANSIIIATVGTNDLNMSAVKCVAAAGSFTMYPDAPPSAETRVNFLVTN